MVKLCLCHMMDTVIYQLCLTALSPFAGGGRSRGVKFGSSCSWSIQEQSQPSLMSSSYHITGTSSCKELPGVCWR